MSRAMKSCNLMPHACHAVRAVSHDMIAHHIAPTANGRALFRESPLAMTLMRIAPTLFLALGLAAPAWAEGDGGPVPESPLARPMAATQGELGAGGTGSSAGASENALAHELPVTRALLRGLEESQSLTNNAAPSEGRRPPQDEGWRMAG